MQKLRAEKQQAKQQFSAVQQEKEGLEAQLTEVMANAQAALAELSAVKQTDSERAEKLQQLQMTHDHLKSSVRVLCAC